MAGYPGLTPGTEGRRASAPRRSLPQGYRGLCRAVLTTAPEKGSRASLGSRETVGLSGCKAYGRDSKRPSECPWPPRLSCMLRLPLLSQEARALTGRVPRQAGSWGRKSGGLLWASCLCVSGSRGHLERPSVPAGLPSKALASTVSPASAPLVGAASHSAL